MYNIAQPGTDSPEFAATDMACRPRCRLASGLRGKLVLASAIGRPALDPRNDP